MYYLLNKQSLFRQYLITRATLPLSGKFTSEIVSHLHRSSKQTLQKDANSMNMATTLISYVIVCSETRDIEQNSYVERKETLHLVRVEFYFCNFYTESSPTMTHNFYLV